jgi:hypothetical protein
VKTGVKSDGFLEYFSIENRRSENRGGNPVDLLGTFQSKIYGYTRPRTNHPKFPPEFTSVFTPGNLSRNFNIYPEIHLNIHPGFHSKLHM